MNPLTCRSVLLGATTVLVACGSESHDLPLEVSSFAADRESAAWSAWSDPVPVVEVNTSANETRGTLSKDGLSLYFHSNRSGGLGFNDIWVAQRECLECAWGEPVVLGRTVNTAAFGEGSPRLSRDEHWLFFGSSRSGLDHPGHRGGNDLWGSYRENVHDDFGWGPATNLGPGVNSSGNESQPSYFENEGGRAQLFFVRPAAPGKPRIWVSEMQTDGAWGTAVEVEELAGFNGPAIHQNGLEMYMFRFRLWRATRKSVDLDAPWSDLVELDELAPGEFGTFQPSIHARGRTETLLMSGGTTAGGQEIYVSTRTRGASAP